VDDVLLSARGAPPPFDETIRRRRIRVLRAEQILPMKCNSCICL
jgi:hypothetical protein